MAPSRPATIVERLRDSHWISPTELGSALFALGDAEALDLDHRLELYGLLYRLPLNLCDRSKCALQTYLGMRTPEGRFGKTAAPLQSHAGETAGFETTRFDVSSVVGPRASLRVKRLNDSNEHAVTLHYERAGHPATATFEHDTHGYFHGDVEVEGRMRTMAFNVVTDKLVWQADRGRKELRLLGHGITEENADHWRPEVGQGSQRDWALRMFELYYKTGRSPVNFGARSGLERNGIKEEWLPEWYRQNDPDDPIVFTRVQPPSEPLEAKGATRIAGLPLGPFDFEATLSLFDPYGDRIELPARVHGQNPGEIFFSYESRTLPGTKDVAGGQPEGGGWFVEFGLENQLVRARIDPDGGTLAISSHSKLLTSPDRGPGRRRVTVSQKISLGELFETGTNPVSGQLGLDEWFPDRRYD